ncbi:hypothetical protein [uncultured Ruminococcus sp.]|uniref:hypothetical protein n=1 Tax=uncultured Ruminococcus sp. TaxID=165186 RepID=UPI002612E69B|nr:hypothetical protein [uncultured Ruminococcus sp.]
MNEELLFEYPLKADRKRFESEILSAAPENFKAQRARAFVILIIGYVLIPLSDIIPWKMPAKVVPIIGVVLVILAILRMKTLINARRTGIEIDAYETYMQITYLDNINSYPRKTVKLYYDNIVLCNISNSCESAMMIYQPQNSEEICIDRNGEKTVENVLNGQLIFDINPYSYEQYFFLYVAPRLFKTSTKGWKTAKKFGTEYEYITKYLQ